MVWTRFGESLELGHTTLMSMLGKSESSFQAQAREWPQANVVRLAHLNWQYIQALQN